MEFTWTELIPGVGTEYAHVATAGIAGALLIGTSLVGRAALGSGDQAVLPANRFSIRGIVELCTEFVTSQSDTVVGHEGRKYVPLFAAIFFWTIFNNLLGLLPGMIPATENINTSLAMGLVTFIYYVFHGLRANGMGFFKHMAGPVWYLAPLVFTVELISHFVRPMTLALRLANVLKGDHTVFGVFLKFVPVGVPVAFYGLGLLTCLIQAFVFMLLTMVYVSLAIAHDEH